MKRKPIAQNWLIVSLPLVGMTAAIVLFFYLPNQQEIRSRHVQIKTLQKGIELTGTTDALIEATRQQLKETRQYVETWEARQAKQTEMHQLFADVNLVIKSSGCAVDQFAPATPVLYHTFQEVPVKLACRGKFGQLWEVLTAIDEMPQNIWIENLQIQVADTKSADNAALECEADLVVFASRISDSD